VVSSSTDFTFYFDHFVNLFSNDKECICRNKYIFEQSIFKNNNNLKFKFMNKIYRLSLTLFMLFMAAALFAQAPQKINYQAVARDNTGAIIANTQVYFILTIHDGSLGGPDVFHETHVITTNQFGLVNLIIGNGTSQSGTIAGVNWSSGDKYLQVQLSTDNGSTYNTVGTPQLLSVP
jgi:hypothetical protein